jgi:signal transduction histidine kinase
LVIHKKIKKNLDYTKYSFTFVYQIKTTMIKSIEEKRMGKVEIDLTGPDGNAFVLIGLASKWSKQLGLDSKKIQEELTSGDYDNLINTIEKYFGQSVILYR